MKNPGATSLRRYWVFAAVFIAVITVGLSTVRLRAQDSGSKMTMGHKEVVDLIKNAKEPGDHEKLAAYYRSKAEQAKATIAEHKEMLDAYVSNPSTHNNAKAEGGPTAMCQTLIRIYGQEERTNASLANYHDKMAKSGEPK